MRRRTINRRLDARPSVFDLNYCSSLVSLFTESFLSKVSKRTHWPLLRTILRDVRFDKGLLKSATLGMILDRIYDELVRGYRCEYIYKNAIAAELILNSDQGNGGPLTEFRAGDSLADMVVVNGTTYVYEIKTKLDSLSRLPTQIDQYSRVFDRVSVVTHPSLQAGVLSCIGKDIGVLTLSDENELVPLRDASSGKTHIDPALVFDSLRKDEYLEILKDELAFQPKVPNTHLYCVCKEKFVGISALAIHEHFVRVLKKRTRSTNLRVLADRAPDSLKVLFLSGRLTDRQYESALAGLDEPIY